MYSSEEMPIAPAGLAFTSPKLGFPGSFRFWYRPSTVSFRNLFAVSVRSELGTVIATAYRVTGYLGQHDFCWSDPENCLKLLVKTHAHRHSRVALEDLVKPLGQEWLICNAPSEKHAISCKDTEFLVSLRASNGTLKGLTGVYFASNGRGSVKIGKSGRCLFARVQQIQIASPDEIKVVAAISTPFADVVERAIHEKHKLSRLRGEWFAMTDEQAIEIAIAHGGMPVQWNTLETHD